MNRHLRRSLAANSPKNPLQVKPQLKAELVGPYLPLVNHSPQLQSLLYDVDLLPEQINTAKNCHRFIVICELFKISIISAKFDESTRGLLATESEEEMKNFAAQLNDCVEKYREIVDFINVDRKQ